MVTMQDIDELDLSTTPYDGCGKCLVGMARLSSMNDTTDSPAKQVEHAREEAALNGGHIIGWAVDLDVSGATNPFARKGFGPWLTGKKGPYDGIVASAVDRIGRNLVDVLITGYHLRDNGKLIITRGHSGPWNLYDSNDEQDFTFRALGAQMEHRSAKRRSNETFERLLREGHKIGLVAHGYRYVRIGENRKVDHIAIDEYVLAYLEDTADRLLADETGLVTLASECRRLTAAKILTPSDYRRFKKGLEQTGAAWDDTSLREILTSPATLGYLMRKGKPVLDTKNPDPAKRGRPVRIAPPMWGYAKHVALVKKLTPKPRKPQAENVPVHRAPRTDALMSGTSFCGQCGYRSYVETATRRHTKEKIKGYSCRARSKGFKGAENCTHSPYITMDELDRTAAEEFLTRFGQVEEYEEVYDAGSDATARLAEVEAERNRLRDDRNAGLYDEPDDAEWYRSEFKRLTAVMNELKAAPQRQAGMYWRPTGVTVADRWNATDSNAERRVLMAAYQFRAEIFPTTAPQRVVFYAADADTAEVARRESWEAHVRLTQAEEGYLDRTRDDQAAAEALDEQAADATEVPELVDQIAGRWTGNPAPEELDLTA
jgi:DNA invertase Pin-like site-specific DNA recombinase